jgi:hypothetical protein
LRHVIQLLAKRRSAEVTPFIPFCSAATGSTKHSPRVRMESREDKIQVLSFRSFSFGISGRALWRRAAEWPQDQSGKARTEAHTQVDARIEARITRPHNELIENAIIAAEKVTRLHAP